MEAVSDGLRNRRSAAKIFKEFDAFPKVEEDYQETSTSGGTVSILVFLFIGILVTSEVIYYMQTDITYLYQVDKDADHKIRINIDMTVAMDCDDIGADVLDVAGASIPTDNHLKMEPSYFKMSNKQFDWWKAFRQFRQFDEGYRSLKELSQMSLIFGHALPTYIPEVDKKEFADKNTDACRIYGNVEVNKVRCNLYWMHSNKRLEVHSVYFFSIRKKLLIRCEIMCFYDNKERYRLKGFRFFLELSTMHNK